MRTCIAGYVLEYIVCEDIFGGRSLEDHVKDGAGWVADRVVDAGEWISDREDDFNEMLTNTGEMLLQGVRYMSNFPIFCNNFGGN